MLTLKLIVVGRVPIHIVNPLALFRGLQHVGAEVVARDVNCKGAVRGCAYVGGYRGVNDDLAILEREEVPIVVHALHGIVVLEHGFAAGSLVELNGSFDECLGVRSEFTCLGRAVLIPA